MIIGRIDASGGGGGSGHRVERDAEKRRERVCKDSGVQLLPPPSSGHFPVISCPKTDSIAPLLLSQIGMSCLL